MSDPKIPDVDPPARKSIAPALLWSIAIALSLAIAVMAWAKSASLQDQVDEIRERGPWPQGAAGDGTWVCESATGKVVAVINPANCGPDDLVLWCEEWDAASGKCVG